MRANAFEKGNRKRDRNCYRGEAERHNDCVGAQPSRSAAHRQQVDERRRQQRGHQHDRERHGGHSHREKLGRCRRGRENEIEIRARIECVRHSFQRVRQHQRPDPEQAPSDNDQAHFIGVEPDLGNAPDHEIGQQMHEGCEQD